MDADRQQRFLEFLELSEELQHCITEIFVVTSFGDSAHTLDDWKLKCIAYWAAKLERIEKSVTEFESLIVAVDGNLSNYAEYAVISLPSKDSNGELIRCLPQTMIGQTAHGIVLVVLKEIVHVAFQDLYIARLIEDEEFPSDADYLTQLALDKADELRSKFWYVSYDYEQARRLAVHLARERSKLQAFFDTQSPPSEVVNQVPEREVQSISSEGPTPPNMLIWNGHQEELKPTEFRLLETMWPYKDDPEPSVRLVDVYKRAWSDEYDHAIHSTKESVLPSIKGAYNGVNIILRSVKFPKRLSIRGEFLVWSDH